MTGPSNPPPPPGPGRPADRLDPDSPKGREVAEWLTSTLAQIQLRIDERERVARIDRVA